MPFANIGRQSSCVDRVEVLGIGEGYLRRFRDTYNAREAKGPIDQRRGPRSGRRASTDKIEFVVEQHRTRHFGLTVKYFYEALRHGFLSFNLSHTWTKTVLRQRGADPPITPRGAVQPNLQNNLGSAIQSTPLEELAVRLLGFDCKHVT